MLHHRLRGAGRLSNITRISYVSSLSNIITVMSGVQAGDLLVLTDKAYTYDAPPSPAVVPSGFTSIITDSGDWIDSIRSTISYKIANGTESGTTLTGLNGDEERKTLVLFRGNKRISSVTVGDTVTDTSREGSISLTIDSSSGKTPLIIMAVRSYYQSDGGVPAFTYTGETPVNEVDTYYTIKNVGNSVNNVTIGIPWSNDFDGIVISGCYLELE